METTISPDVGGLRTPVGVFTYEFEPLIETEEGCSKCVRVRPSPGAVDMFGRPYPERVVLWVHHFDDYGVLVEGTYEALLAKKALEKAGYDTRASSRGGDIWGWRNIRIGEGENSRSGVAFYFDVEAALG